MNERPQVSTDRIAIICAYNSLRNTGMYTVDEATKIAFSKYNPEQIDYYYLALNKLDTYSDEESTIRCLQLQDLGDGLSSYSQIVFWGDFLHSYAYWTKDFLPRLIAQGICKDNNEALDLAYNYLMLESLPDEELKKVIIFGSTCIPDNAFTLLDKRFVKSFDRLISNAGLVMFRDPISASRNSFLRPFDVLVGTDCATLHALKKPKKVNKNGPVGVFVGRSSAYQLLKYVAFIRYYEWKTQTKMSWIQWTGYRPFHKYVKILLGVSKEPIHRSPEQTIDELEKCSFVISDTYHFCVNAWSRGIPAVCIGSGALFDEGTLGSKKKESFYTYIYAEKYYFFWEKFTFLSFHKLVDKMEALRKDGNAISFIHQKVRKYAGYSLDRLNKFLA